MRRVKKACVSSSAIPSRWSTQPSRVTLMLKVKSPMRRVYARQTLADVLASELVGRDDPPPDPGGAGLDRLPDRGVVRRPRAYLDDQALLATREAIGSSWQTPGSVYTVLLAFVVPGGVAAVQRRARLRREGGTRYRAPNFRQIAAGGRLGRDRSDAPIG